MKDYTIEQKKQLRDRIVAMQEASGLSANIFATTRLGFSNGSKFSHVRNNWDQAGMVGNDTWEAIERLIEKSEGYRGVITENLKKVWNTCERAYALKKAMPIIGEGGYGKTFSLEKYKEHNEKNKRFKVIIFDASETKTQKQLIVGLLWALDSYRPGTISDQIRHLRESAMKRGDFLLGIDEASSLRDHHVVILKDVITALKDICGIIITGTPYFINNLNNGALRNRHLFSETRDRLFLLPELLDQPTEAEALAIFEANGITAKEDLDIVMGRKKEFLSHSWLAKRTFRGIKDSIDMLRMADMPDLDFNNIQL
jgi:hypothetical protein